MMGLRRRAIKCESEANCKNEESKVTVDDGKNVKLKKLRETFEHLCGFAVDDLCSYERFTKLMYRPTDAACLGVVRALFGLCMIIDVVEERGLSNIDIKWGDPDTCHFPLVHGLRPLTLPWMIVLYAVMWLGAFGIMLGLYFKQACALFVIPYWYLFLLDKSFWNNHTYLYGVVALLFWSTDANRYFSLDAKRADIKKEAVPYWNYFILKFQFFALYFLAGLKKSSREWLEGYAMTNLSRHWVFEPFKLFLSTEQTDFFIVHWFGFIFDLTVGFFMLFDLTRIPAMFFCTAFHLMNSRLFSIGMFPYVCLATMPLFCSVDWPRKFGKGSCTQQRQQVKSSDEEEEEEEEEKEETMVKEVEEVESSSARKDCDSRNNDRAVNDTGHATAMDGSREKREKKRLGAKTSRKQKLVVAVLLFHITLQFFLPYSHFITKGYNNWVPGLYGYSWDMMVHAWDTILIVVKVHDNERNKDYFLDPGAWVVNDRWAKHGDMVRQYGHCIKENLDKLKNRQTATKGLWSNLSSNVSIYVDVWCSLNGRFQQRLFNPTIDMLKVDWHPFKPVSYVMPLLHQFSSYRTELDRIQQDVYSWSNYTDVLFVADYPGMQLENYIDAELSNVTLSVLEGEVKYRVEVDDVDEEEKKITTTNEDDNYVDDDDDDEAKVKRKRKERKKKNSYIGTTTISKGNKVRIETGRFHKVLTTSPHPACYMYTFANLTKQQLARQGIKEQTAVKEPFPVVKEIGYRIDSFGRSFAYIVNALLNLIFDVPMIRRVSLN